MTRIAESPAGSEKTFFGHPRGLATLFFTEMWERFSYYGLRALLILFMTAGPEAGGLGFDVATAGAVYGLYTSMVYMMSVPGGWIADRVLGLRRAVLYGGVIIALGHYSLAAGSLASFYLGLALVVLGTGLLKPNISVIVGQLYAPADQRRDAGFSIFYMGINLGAFIAPLACGWVGQRIDWHLGFGLAGIGMTLGLIQYLAGRRHLRGIGEPPTAPDAQTRRKLIWGISVTGGAALLVALLAFQGLVTPKALAGAAGIMLLAVVIGLFGWMFLAGSWSAAERRRLAVIALLFAASTIFWSVFEQAGSTLNLFAARNTRTAILGFDFPASWLQSVNGLLIILLAPVFAWLWLALGRRDPSSPAKFSLGLLFAGLGFAVLALGATGAGGARISPLWLVVTYVCHTIGELCLSPVGLSAMTKLAPERVAGLMMGAWFLSLAAGNYLGGRVSTFYEALSLPALFTAVAAYAMVAAVAMALLIRPARRLMSGAG
ncbi:MAG: peptide MFS transporter [Acidobacteria bacterium]|nr:peptide MFS transporter [Acidobacteriota bacterium]